MNQEELRQSQQKERNLLQRMIVELEARLISLRKARDDLDKELKKPGGGKQ